MTQPASGLYLGKYADSQLLIERRNHRMDFMQALGSVPVGALAANGVRKNKLTNSVGFRANNTEDFESKQMTGKSYIVLWEVYDTEPSSCTGNEVRYLTFNKCAAIRVKHNETLQVDIRNHVLHKLAPEDNSNGEVPVIQATGEENTSDRLRPSYKDLVDFTTFAETWNLPVTGALCMALSPLHVGDSLLDKDTSKHFYNHTFHLDSATGKPEGFVGIKSFENNGCPFYNTETAKKAAEGIKSFIETDSQASTLFYTPNTYYHIESVRSLYRLETIGTCSKSPTSEYRTQTYGIVDRIGDFGADAVLSDKSVQRVILWEILQE